MAKRSCPEVPIKTMVTRRSLCYNYVQMFLEKFGKVSGKYFVHFIFNFTLQMLIETKKKFNRYFLWGLGQIWSEALYFVI